MPQVLCPCLCTPSSRVFITDDRYWEQAHIFGPGDVSEKGRDHGRRGLDLTGRDPLMADLLQTARLFEVGTRLQTASSNLMSIAEGNQPDAGALKWAGEFLSQVDWTSGIGSQAGVDGALTAAAANTRPKFFAALLRIQGDFQRAGIDSDERVYGFLKDVYTCLESGGTKKSTLRSEHLRLAGELLHVLSRSIMVDLSNNGLPRREPIFSIGE